MATLPSPQYPTMASPFVHTQSPNGQYPYQYQHTPYYYFASQPGTPLIPDASLYHASPYSNPPSLPGSPHILPVSPAAGGAFPTPTIPTFEQGYLPAWDPYTRERRPSWHANTSPWVYPSHHGPIYPPAPAPALNRRHSFGAANYPSTPVLFTNNTPFQPYGYPQLLINPWLNAEAPRADFLFDLSTSHFAPMRTYCPGQVGPLTQDELMQPATQPPITKLRILCAPIPQWPIDLQPKAHMVNPYWSPGTTYQAPPIVLGDVLVAIHMHMHQRISHTDWAKLSQKEMVAVGRAYTERCRAARGTADHELAQGVKRVDFLRGKTKMVGLVRQQQVDGWEVMKLHVSR